MEVDLALGVLEELAQVEVEAAGEGHERLDGGARQAVVFGERSCGRWVENRNYVGHRHLGFLAFLAFFGVQWGPGGSMLVGCG